MQAKIADVRTKPLTGTLGQAVLRERRTRANLRVEVECLARRLSLKPAVQHMGVRPVDALLGEWSRSSFESSPLRGVAEAACEHASALLELRQHRRSRAARRGERTKRLGRKTRAWMQSFLPEPQIESAAVLAMQEPLPFETVEHHESSRGELASTAGLMRSKP